MKSDIQKNIEESIDSQRIFNSPSIGNLTFKEVIFHIAQWMHQEPDATYTIIIGTDSQKYQDRVDFVSAIVVHRIGHGGVYFWRKHRDASKMYVLQDRMYQEALLSMELARTFLDEFVIEGIFKFKLEIHVDIGLEGKTREVINGVVGMLRGSGFEVKTKPHAIGASSVADKYT